MVMTENIYIHIYMTVQKYDELVGTYMLSLISEKHNKKDFRLYRDDELGVVKNKNGPELEKIK